MDALTTNVPRKKGNERKGKERKGKEKEARKKKERKKPKLACPLAIILEYSFIFNIFQ